MQKQNKQANSFPFTLNGHAAIPVQEKLYENRLDLVKRKATQKGKGCQLMF